MGTNSIQMTVSPSMRIKSSLIRRFTILMVLLLSLQSVTFAKAKQRSVIAKNAKPEKLAGDFSFTEGPARDRQGNVYFTDQPNNRIMKWSTDKKLTLFGENFGRANGMYFDNKGNLISCSDEKNELWKIENIILSIQSEIKLLENMGLEIRDEIIKKDAITIMGKTIP